ncbi:unnamed protein product [Paramecium sonneborni]|uniref:Uncharacterized protein n=1 Tax=Paramecium sonneborni TaxID=65129 RepID=A0A8S1R8I7_9CILI|nr:unnamed protein product [Paramecium sonneborni]
MNSQIKNFHALQKTIIWKQSKKWDNQKYQIVKEKIQITIYKNNEIIYSASDGEILRIEYSKENLKSHFLFNNLEQIKNLQWSIEYRQNSKKSVKWSATWCGEILKGVGGYINDGLKQGVWKELIYNYSSQAKIYEIGEYYNDKKKGLWEFIFENKKIGLYNEKGQKHGKWKELSDEFWDKSQVIFNGEYKNGKKIGRWDTLYGEFELIGGGSYDELGNCIKNGHWIELNDGFWSQSQIISNGEYRNGKKVDRWETLYRQMNKEHFQKIGGGFYSKNDNLKIGQWIELSDGFWYDSQVTIYGEYKNGIKIGRWNIWYNNRDTNKNCLIGGGFYDVNGEGIKKGKWIELNHTFWIGAQITFNGEYKNGKRAGFQNILYKNKQIGGGLLDKGDDEIKVGKWIEQYEQFYDDLQIIYNGVYSKGKKVGRWDILFRKVDKYQIIGGGSYHKEDDEIKVGKWTELSKEFKIHSQITYIGEYKNNKKVGNWDIYWNWFGNIKIGGGSYDEIGNGMKIGKWIEYCDYFRDYSQLFFIGGYKNGSKIGKWDILFKRMNLEQMQNIHIKQITSGGGQYSIAGDGIKNGKWIEVIFEFTVNLQLTFNGEYKNGKKIGKWDIWQRDNIINKFEKIGGGLYSQGGDGFKIGKWIELSDQFKQFEQVSYSGVYKNGKKVGRWDIWYKDCVTKKNEQIGGGFYDEEGDGIKIGSWIELCEGFKKNQLFSKEITYNGEYKNDRKVGRWDIMYREWKKENFHQIGYGYYNESGDGIKIGKWMELSYWFYVDMQITYIGEYQNGKKVGAWFEFDLKKNEKLKETKYEV